MVKGSLEIFPLLPASFRMHENYKNVVLEEKHLFISTTLPQFEDLSLVNLYLSVKYEIALF